MSLIILLILLILLILSVILLLTTNSPKILEAPGNLDRVHPGFWAKGKSPNGIRGFNSSPKFLEAPAGSSSPGQVTGVVAHGHTRILASDMRDVQEKLHQSIGIL